MNINIANERCQYVLRPDSMSTSQGDFLATHVPVKRLQVLNKFELNPSKGKNDSYTSEEEVYNSYIKNPPNIDRFIAVYGQSGTGKSHLIRWFNARFSQDKSENEVVIFVRRSDNTLKGTIKQLLETPEIKLIKDNEIYKRLIKASNPIPEAKLKDMIYQDFIVEIKNENEGLTKKLRNTEKRRLVAFLSNDLITERLKAFDGPIERIFSKVAENEYSDRDTVAEFRPEDFDIDTEFYEELVKSEADKKAIDLARTLLSSDKGTEKKAELAEYLNQFVENVVQSCSGIEPGDFRDIFIEIRKKLYEEGKNLTIFIEDITSFTGVDRSLLDALIEEHTSTYDEEKVCRISAIVGGTNYYIDTYFKDNHKSRIAKYIYIPDDIFDQNGIYEFVAKYLNTMSLTKETIDKWMEKKAIPSEYPVHEVKEGKDWDFIVSSEGKSLCLYPFTKNSIDYFYKYKLIQDHRTPRYILRDIIEPVVQDIMRNEKDFPNSEYSVFSSNTKLQMRLENEIKDREIRDRLYRFICIWGNSNIEQTELDGELYFAGVKKSVYDELGLPIINCKKVEVKESKVKPINEIPDNINKNIVKTSNAVNTVNQEEKKSVPPEIENKINDVSNKLNEWVNGKELDLSKTMGTSNVLKNARDNMNKFVYSAINWQAEGVPNDNVKKIKNSTAYLVDFDNLTKFRTKGFYTLPAERESVWIILAFVKWKELGNESWDYEDSDVDAFIVTDWISSIKDELIKSVELYNDNIKTNYIDSAVIAQIYTSILNGEFTEKNLKNYNLEKLFKLSDPKLTNSGHSKEWNGLLEFITKKREDNLETIKSYFNLNQGDSSGAKGIMVLDRIKIQKELTKVKANDVFINKEERQLDDRVKGRKEVNEFSNKILNDVSVVATAEMKKAQKELDEILEFMDIEDLEEEDILELIEDINDFYRQANDVQINVATAQTKYVKDHSKQIVKAVNDISNAMDKTDTLDILLAFSSDPLSRIVPLRDLLKNVNECIIKANARTEKRLNELNEFNSEVSNIEKYDYAVNVLNEDILKIGELR